MRDLLSHQLRPSSRNCTIRQQTANWLNSLCEEYKLVNIFRLESVLITLSKCAPLGCLSKVKSLFACDLFRFSSSSLKLKNFHTTKCDPRTWGSILFSPRTDTFSSKFSFWLYKSSFQSISGIHVVCKTGLLTQQFFHLTPSWRFCVTWYIDAKSFRSSCFCAVGVTNENVAGETRSAYSLAADVLIGKSVTESSTFRNEIAASMNRLQSSFVVNHAALLFWGPFEFPTPG